jgi:hypothetical protein
MKNALYVADCPFCRVGELIIFREVESGQYFLRCEECVLEWTDVERIADKNAGTPFVFGPSVPATPDEMKNHPWARRIARSTWPGGPGF